MNEKSVTLLVNEKFSFDNNKQKEMPMPKEGLDKYFEKLHPDKRITNKKPSIKFPR